ncbi:hypothetical protein [Saccharophagus degradans]|uniref:Uncharacterized protein n=1 Tax=Saccharophagus degradans (strain 2-40 / ATCC 43961 / DSM 17024) TaxID=203122 RepID=Q21P17_SACD2|nr:hypothetical protein [Saccharophagus degradans]ABD79562.1 hypothetical protein Sde_0298 [Saccharophagus degradans 2-40]
MNTELDDKLALLINGQLDVNEQAELEKQIAANEELAAEAEFLGALQKGIQQQHAVPPGAMGLARLKRDIASEQRRTNTEAQATVSSGNATGKVKAASNFWKPLSIAACCLLAVQSFLTMQGPSGDDPSGVVPLSGSALPAGPQLQVVFKDTATAGQIREGLLSINAELISGPGALGIYTVQLPANADISQAQILLSGLPFIEEVEVVTRANES